MFRVLSVEPLHLYKWVNPIYIGPYYNKPVVVPFTHHDVVVPIDFVVIRTSTLLF